MNTRAALVEHSAVELRRMIGRREISPVELMDACIERIETVNPAVNAIAATCFAEAREEARQAERAVLKGERLGLLHGLPLGVKDLEDTAGLLTTYGSPIYRSHVPDKDGLIVERLRASGAILAAKTNVPEMGAGANTRNPVWGATGNPFNPELNAGGSSGGSAAALACDMLPVCTGSDTGGSLRIPASKCGVVGFRPTPGLVPNSRRPLGWTPISVVGPMGRTVADTALQLAATSGLSAVDPLSYEVDPLGFASLDEFDLSTLRVGWTEDFGVCDVDETIRQTFRSRIAAISGLVHSCQEVSFVLGDAHRCFDVIRAEGFVAGLHDAYSRNPEDLGANARVNYELGAQMSLADCAWAHAEQTRLMRRFQATFSDCDVILAPTTPVSPFPWRQAYAMTISGRQQENYYRWLALTYVVTLTTNPAISMPCGVDEFGMPFGIQVVGPFRNDRRLLTIALAFERAFEQRPSLRRPKPDLSRLGEPTLSLTSIVTAPPIFNPAGDYQTGTSIV